LRETSIQLATVPGLAQWSVGIRYEIKLGNAGTVIPRFDGRLARRPCARRPVFVRVRAREAL